jgi:hypothetical protein
MYSSVRFISWLLTRNYSTYFLAVLFCLVPKHYMHVTVWMFTLSNSHFPPLLNTAHVYTESMERGCMCYDNEGSSYLLCRAWLVTEGTRRRMGQEVKGKVENGVSLARPRNMAFPAQSRRYRLTRTPRLPVVYWILTLAELHELVHLTQRRNLVSAHVPSYSQWSIPTAVLLSGNPLPCVKRPEAPSLAKLISWTKWLEYLGFPWKKNDPNTSHSHFIHVPPTVYKR